MPVYKSIEDDNAHVLRLKNFIILLANQGVAPTDLSARVQASPPALVTRALSELVQEGKLELSSTGGA